MKVIFEPEDTLSVVKTLREFGISDYDQRIRSVLYNVEAAYKQQLEEEIEYMVLTFEADGGS